MGRTSRLLWFAAGFGMATAAVALIEAAPAAAQASRAVAPAADRSLPSASSRNRAAEPSLYEAETAPDLPPALPADDPAADPQELDDLEPRPRAGQRAVVRDGDIAHPADQALSRDGIVDVGEPDAPQDGVDPTSVDTRPPEDIAVFENPPAGHDPLLFQIEDLDPVADRRTRRLFTREPYDPVGIPIGSFVLFPELETGLSWYSNVFRAPRARSDAAVDFRPSARLVSNWRTHALELRALGNASFFEEYDSENDKGYLLEARGRLDVTRRTNVQALVSRELTQESRSAIDASSAGDRADLLTTRAALTANHRFNRLAVQFRGSVTEFDIGPQQSGPVVVSNDERDYLAYEEAVRVTWELKPTLFVFSEVALNQRRFDVAAASDGIRRDSNGERYRLGLGFGETGRILRGEIALGYGIQRPDDARLEAIDGIIVDANVAWRVSELTSLLFNARSDVSETTTAGSGGVFTRSAGIEARHSLRRNLIGSAGLQLTWQDYAGAPIEEQELRATLGLEYFLSREAVLFGRYAHTRLDSNQPATDFANDEVRVGVRLRR